MMHTLDIKMKTFFIGWILLQLALCVIGDVSSLKSPRNVCLQKINTARAEYAKVHHIANMNKLAYYDIFERNMINAVSSNTACSEPRVTHNSSVDVFWNMNDDGELVAQLLSKPGRSLMACVKQHCPDTGKNVLSVIVDSSTKDTFDGEPGSECSRFRTPQQNGLCVLRRGYQRKGLIGDVTGAITGAAMSVVKGGAKIFGDVAQNVAPAVANLVGDVAKGVAKKIVKDAIDDGIEILKENIKGKLELLVPDVMDKLKGCPDSISDYSGGSKGSFGGFGNGQSGSQSTGGYPYVGEIFNMGINVGKSRAKSG